MNFLWSMASDEIIFLIHFNDDDMLLTIYDQGNNVFHHNLLNVTSSQYSI